MEVTAMSEKTGISNDVLIEIVHSIKDIIVALIDRAFPRGSHKQDEYEKIYNPINEQIHNMHKNSSALFLC
jgi:hypothetical protein